MQRGTALKWADALRSTDAHYAKGQLGYTIGQTRYLSPMGVLADFLDPNGWTLGWDGVSLLWRGSQFVLPADARKSCKMKTTGYEPLALKGEEETVFSTLLDGKSLADIEDTIILFPDNLAWPTHRAFAHFVETHYPVF